MKVLITGGAGYIGSSCASACLDGGHEVVVWDDLSTGREEFVKDRPFHAGDIADPAVLDNIVAAHPDIDAVIHCAAKIIVPESVENPMLYHDNNVVKTITLLDGLARHGIDRVVFSSSASIYDSPESLEVTEDSPIRPTSPYARTKHMMEYVLEDRARATSLRAMALRYFNPIGADPAMRTGQQLLDGSHVLAKLLAARRSGTPFTITGTDWPTRDGSGIRDYVHVWDLARAHVAAVERFDQVVTPEEPFLAVNLGTGRGVTVRELVDAFVDVLDAHDLQVVEGPPRPGDAAGAYTVSKRAGSLLGWQAELDIARGIADAFEWQRLWAGRVA